MRLIPVPLLTVFLAACGSVKPVDSPPIASAAKIDPKAQAEELAAKGVIRNDENPPKISHFFESEKDFEVHQLTIPPRGSTFSLVRYLMTPEEWMLTNLEYKKDGTRIYEFRRIISKGPRVEIDPFKPPPKVPNNR